jgi:hypothetical protein
MPRAPPLTNAIVPSNRAIDPSLGRHCPYWIVSIVSGEIPVRRRFSPNLAATLCERSICHPGGDLITLDRKQLLAYRLRVNRSLQRRLWPKAPPPGALVIGGEIFGPWRRRLHRVAITPWRTISKRHMKAAEQLAASWPVQAGSDLADVTWVIPG